jgi:hypothetical protein
MTNGSLDRPVAAEPVGRRLAEVRRNDPAKRGWAEELAARARRERVELAVSRGRTA